MLMGRVEGSIWCTRKDDELSGMKLMRVRHFDGEKQGSIVIAVDLIGAGIGESVLMTKGSSARRLEGLENAPIDCIIVGIIDEESL